MFDQITIIGIKTCYFQHTVPKISPNPHCTKLSYLYVFAPDEYGVFSKALNKLLVQFLINTKS